MPMGLRMVGYVYDDGGRAAAGYKGKTGDCVVRAYCILTGADYRDTYRDIADDNETRGQKRSVRSGANPNYSYPGLGLVKVKLPKGPRPTYTEAHERYGDCIVRTAKHVAAVVDGNLRDIFDGRTYLMDDEYGVEHLHDRKAQSVWVVAK